MVSFMLLRISNGGGVGQLLFPVAVIPANDVADFGVFCHSRNVAIEAWRLLAGAIDRLYGQIGEFERGNAAQIDGTDFGPIGTNAICKGLRSACLTELMVDLVRVEGIGSKCIFARQQRKRSEEHTSELQSLMRTSYAVFFLKQKRNTKTYSC